VFLEKLFSRFVLLIQLILVVIFIVFEEVIWEGIAKPIYEYIHELHILQTLEQKLITVNRYVILVLFLILLIGVEGAGLAAGVLAVRGMVLAAALLYGLKIPIAAFTFWLFRATEEKLLSFGWFRWSYEKIMVFFEWIKEREIYRSARTMFTQIKASFNAFKVRYFSGENTITKRFKRLYKAVKSTLKRSSD
jgi:hypothetical protein